MAFNLNDMCNPCNPISPLNPLNPASPLSPLNPMNQEDRSGPTGPTYEDKFSSFMGDLGQVSHGDSVDWLTGQGKTGQERPGPNSLKATAQGFSLQLVRHGLFGPTREVEYLFDRQHQKVEAHEHSLRGAVGQFFSGQPKDEAYLLDLRNHTLTQHQA